ncbi:MAG TPA: DUF4157 domain-containing protein, partial [Chloroflexota bacterium]|nr:DUF4157 domain-containing protein [Chloroflexota bacterium]
MAEHSIDLSEHKALKRQTTEGGPTTDSGPAVHPLLQLQSQVGNAQVARMLAQREAAPDEDEVAAKHDVQRAEDDEEVQAHHDASLQRAEDDDELQAKHDDDERVGIEGGAVGPDTQSRIQAARGGGSSLDGGVRTSMEASFGTSFEGVRVHHNSESDALSRRLTAKAFTTGSDIFLRSDSSPSDTKLLGHELTHVVQQRSMGGGGGGMSVGAAGDPHEQHADSMADSVATQAPAPVAAQHDVAQRAGEDEEDVAAQHDVA